MTARELAAVHGAMRMTWEHWLTPQDRQPLRAHVTVQNKVTPEAARALAEALAASFSPWTARTVGVDVWEYAGGPWEHVRRTAFQAARDSEP